ncbi:MAG: DUF2188 domain-containing protein [Acidobacteria bacterium]|jgi:hypothetical protein|nr:DUF2188 domain-containing protein [Acidobacteriota bacterium]MDQ3712240.1 DUF2188 domain-containing protein [Acidobacteriota bacterium]
MTKRVISEVSTTGKISREKIDSVVRGVHVAPVNEGWQVRKSGRVRVTENFPSKEAAVSYAKSISQKKGVDLFVHSKDGNVKKASNGCSYPSGKNSK